MRLRACILIQRDNFVLAGNEALLLYYVSPLTMQPAPNFFSAQKNPLALGRRDGMGMGGWLTYGEGEISIDGARYFSNPSWSVGHAYRPTQHELLASANRRNWLQLARSAMPLSRGRAICPLHHRRPRPLANPSRAGPLSNGPWRWDLGK